jgi:hypothetical protein
MDAFSIATGALQVADAGFKLYGALSEYIKNVKNAEKDLKGVQAEVKTASWALKELGLLIQQDEAIKKCRPR